MNANSQDAPATPVLNGYVITWDYDTCEWVAQSKTSDTVLRGKDQDALVAAWWDHLTSLADQLSQILREAPAHDHTPPTRTDRSARPEGQAGRAEP